MNKPPLTGFEPVGFPSYLRKSSGRSENMTELDEKSPGKTLYDESQSREKAPVLKIITATLMVLLLLFTVRFLDHLLWWNVSKLELKHSKTAGIEDFTFLGLSTYNKAQKKLALISQTTINDKCIVSYYDIIHPNVFIVNNRGAGRFVNLGLMNVYAEPGITTFFFHPSEIIETGRENVPAKAFYFGISLFPQLFKTLAKQISTGENERGISFILNPIENSKCLKIPYMVYFFLPLLIIIMLGAGHRRFFISFFYYLGLLLLFDFKRIFFIAPFSWLTDLVGLDVSRTAAIIISAIMLILFIIAGFWGIFSKHKKESLDHNGRSLTVWGKGVIIFFFLLPLALRF